MGNIATAAEEAAIQDAPFARSISDDDLCSSCKRLAYCPGLLSLCREAVMGEWPADFNGDGYAVACPSYQD